MRKLLFIHLFFILISAGCKRDNAIVPKVYQSKKVVLIVIDGVRYHEINSDSALSVLPEWSSLVAKGNLHEAMYNDGITNTVNGLVHLTTGQYSSYVNSGNAAPNEKTIFHYYLQQTKLPSKSAALFSSKDKIKVLQNAGGGLAPYTDCGAVAGGYRSDSLTMVVAKDFISINKPDLLVVHFAEPDVSGHSGNYEAYRKAIKTTTAYTSELYNYLESFDEYKGVTTYFISNDHGRHLTDFANHGDKCIGCTHLNFLVIGPDTKIGKTNSRASQIDIPHTMAEIFHLYQFSGKGKVMHDLFK